ncbi:MAG: hypothetical protein EU516_00080 [Promethearchaeota archaeon]|nr:MAG: hypothetical protein EU516_00080 [Candidatus Lokiarchaeota archaeon]
MIHLFFIDLDPLSQLSGILGIISVAVAFFYGILVIIKAIQLKYKDLYYFFFAVIFTISPWYPSGFGYVYWLITNEVIPYPIYVLLGTLGVPVALFSWFQIYIPALHPRIKKPVIAITAILSIIYYVYVFFFLFFAPAAPVTNLIGIKQSVIDIEYKGFALIFLAFSLLVSTITGNEFAINSLKNEEKLIKWKGRFLVLSFNFFAIGAIGDGFLELTPITLIIFRVFMVLSSTFYYLGFILPKWMRKLLKIE